MNNNESPNQHSNISEAASKSAMICLAGDIPQVITESIQALMYYKNEIPNKLYILVTSGAKTNVKDLENEIKKSKLKINNKNISEIQLEEIQLKDDKTGLIIEDIKTENHIQILEKYINQTIEIIKNNNINKIYYCVASGRKVIASVLGYFVQLYGTENDLMFQVQLNYLKDEYSDNEIREKQKEYWHPKEALTLVQIPFYRTNQPVLYKILRHIADKELKQSFLNFYNTIVSPAVSKLLYGFNIYDHFVDHGLNHSLNILKILVDLLNPENKNDIILTDEEVYILACAIMLHDIGMCGNKGNRRSEPGIVRKYHGLISYELLNPVTKNEQNEKHLPNRNIPETITEDGKNIQLTQYLKEISLLCKYHQQSSRMRGKPQFDTNLKEELNTLEYDIKNILKINNDPECNYRTYKLAALLRVLDSFDVQQSRLFNIDVMKKQIDRNEQNKENIKQAIWQVFKSLKTMLSISSTTSNDEYENFFNNHFDDFSEYVNNELNDEIENKSEQYYEKKENYQHLKQLIKQYIEIDIQEPQHYQKHLSIKAVIIKDKKVRLKPDIESEGKKIFTRIAQREIKNEISKLYDIFQKNNIKFHDVIIEGLENYEYEKKIQINDIKDFEAIKKELTQCKTGDFIFTQLSQKISEYGFQLKKIDTSITVTNCDHYYDYPENDSSGILYNEGSRLRLRETTNIDNEKKIENIEKRICFKSSKNKSEKYGNIEIEPIFYDNNIPEKITPDLLKKYFDLDLLKKYFDIEYKKKCKVEVKRQLITIKMESKNDKDRLWAYEVEIALDEITFFDANGKNYGSDFEIEIENTLATNEICDNIYKFIMGKFKNRNLKEINNGDSNKYKKCVDAMKMNTTK